MSKSKLPTFKLAHVSEARKQFLLRWRLERKLDLALRMQQAEEGCLSMVAESGAEYDLSLRPFDKSVCVGDIRLLRQSDVQEVGRLLYVLVLYVRNDNLTSVVVPFSTYSVPCCKDEWLTGLDGEPLKVLQFWNAQPVPTFALAQSWQVGTFDEERLTAAQTLYSHAISGSWPQGALREKVGLAILNPSDERLVYQHEELAQFAKLRSRLFSLQQTATLQAKRSVAFDAKGAFTFVKEKQTFKHQERLAASSGDVFSEVHLCQEDKTVASLRAKREADATTQTFRWHIVGNKECLLPGLPACLYGNTSKKPLLAQGQTEGDGSVITFKALTTAAFTRILKSGFLRIVIALPKIDD
jgi:hypothetical protein